VLKLKRRVQLPVGVVQLRFVLVRVFELRLGGSDLLQQRSPVPLL
jgi:hypothetical protein